MIAKGHDFPRVTLVGVISADVGLGLADFRAAERTFQLLTQVAGRAGRGEIRGQAIVQTLYPDHYSIRHACRQDYVAFFNDEAHFRRVDALSAGRRADQRRRQGPLAGDGRCRTPARSSARCDPGRIATACSARPPAPLSRLKGEHRAQLFLKGTHRTAMREALRDRARRRGPDSATADDRDVDPISVSVSGYRDATASRLRAMESG